MIGIRLSRGVSMNKLLHIAASVAIAWLLVLPARASEITVGLITSMTGPNASIGIPYAKGTAAGVAYKDEVDDALNGTVALIFLLLPQFARPSLASVLFQIQWSDPTCWCTIQTANQI